MWGEKYWEGGAQLFSEYLSYVDLKKTCLLHGTVKFLPETIHIQENWSRAGTQIWLLHSVHLGFNNTSKTNVSEEEEEKGWSSGTGFLNSFKVGALLMFDHLLSGSPSPVRLRLRCQTPTSTTSSSPSCSSSSSGLPCWTRTSSSPSCSSSGSPCWTRIRMWSYGYLWPPTRVEIKHCHRVFNHEIWNFSTHFFQHMPQMYLS